jgi:hypothetical protein
VDAEKKLLIRMIRDYRPKLTKAELARKTFMELAAIYKTIRGW